MKKEEYSFKTNLRTDLRKYTNNCIIIRWLLYEGKIEDRPLKNGNH